MQQAVRDDGDRVGIDDTKTRKSGRKTLSSSRTAPTQTETGLEWAPGYAKEMMSFLNIKTETRTAAETVANTINRSEGSGFVRGPKRLAEKIKR
jgi:hypothetical protein